MKRSDCLGAFVLLLLGSFLLAGCGNPQKAARKALEEKGYEVAARGMNLAAGAGDLESVRLFQEAGFEIDALDERNNTPLIRAAAGGHVEAVEGILGLGADPRHVNAVGRDALLVASAKGFADVSRMLVSRGSDLTTKDLEGWNALSIAAYNGHAEVVSLLASQVDPDSLDDALLVASFSGDVGVINALLGQGANINARSPESKTPLMIASEGGKKDAVRLLLQNQANPYSEDGEGLTAAVLAEQAGFESVKTLILNPEEWGATAESREVLREMEMAQEALATDGSVEETLGEPPAETTEPIELASTTEPATRSEATRSEATRAEANQSEGPIVEGTGPAATQYAESAPVAAGSSGGRSISESGSAPSSTSDGTISRVESAPARATVDRSRIREEAKSKPIVALNGSTIHSRTPREAPVESMVLAAFHEEPLPIAVADVDSSGASFRRLDEDGGYPVEAQPGERIPGTPFEVKEVTRKFVDSKEGQGRMVDVSRVKVQNIESGATHLLVKDVAGQSSDTYAILTAPNSKYRYVVKSGDVFRTSQPDRGEREYQVLDIRAEGVVVKDLATEEVLTIARDGVVSF